jgi:diguanylate cyclase (GGDEF)-like protein
VSETLPASSAGAGSGEFSIRRQLGWAAPAGAAFAVLAAVAGAAFHDRPTLFSALGLVAAVAMLPLLVRALTTRVLLWLDAAAVARDAQQAELAAAHKTKEEFRNLAYHDDLTGLPNRSLLYDRLGIAIEHARRQTSQLAVLFLDLNGFKTVNDSLGHGSGDHLLVELAGRVRRCVRAGDTVARFGGDEFVVLLDGVTGAEDSARVAAKVLDAVQSPFQLDDHELSIGASVGLSLYPDDGTSPDELVKQADAAMYRDKYQAVTPSGERPMQERRV